MFSRTVQAFKAVPMATRALSTSRAVADDLIRPPIQKFGVEGRYAHALYSAAAKTDSLNKVEKEINSLTKLIKTDGGLHTFLKDPVMSRGEKTSVIQDTLTKQKYSQPSSTSLAHSQKTTDSLNTKKSPRALESSCQPTVMKSTAPSPLQRPSTQRPSTPSRSPSPASQAKAQPSLSPQRSTNLFWAAS